MKKTRGAWPGNDPVYIDYHDQEWGYSVHDDQKLFEYLLLETFQAGLSWITILKKRENFRLAFDNFNAKIIAGYDEQKMDELMLDAGIIRNRLKIKSATTNAQLFLKTQQEFGSFDNYIWQFTAHKTIVNHWENIKQLPSCSSESDSMSKDLKKRGFKFVGSTVCYAFMQAVGMIDDHTLDCFRKTSK